MVRLALFDCDGTLADSQHHICTAMEAAFARVGEPAPPRATIRRAVGLSLGHVIAVLAPDADEDRRARLVEAYRTAFFDLRAGGTMGTEPLFEGIAPLLEALSRAGWCMGVATGKSDRGLAHLLEHHAIGGHFATLQTADRHPSKPHPSMIEAAMRDTGAVPEATVMIGDTSFDMEMARAAGVRAIGVGWGYHAPHELEAAGAEHIVSDPAALMMVLAR